MPNNKNNSKFAQSAATVLKAPLPKLCVGTNHTTSSALHKKTFVGKLVHWGTFEAEVARITANLPSKLDQRVISHENLRNSADWYLATEHLVVGDETGVQGRFEQHVGQVLSAILKAGEKDIRLGDYRASSATDNENIPDVVAMETTNSDLRLVGEVKVPWVDNHDLEQALDDEQRLRHVLGQIAWYMYHFQIKYGFMSTYDQTMFLKQELAANGDWELHYSDVWMHTDTSPSIRECVFFLVDHAQASHSAANNTRIQDWVLKSVRK